MLETRSIVLLGRLDLPTDGVRDYCSHLSEAFTRCGQNLEIAEMRWESQTWMKAMRRLWRDSKAWKDHWVLFQYTALMWSRRGFPVRALVALCILRIRGARICVVFHDMTGQPRGWIQRIRIAFQYRTMRAAFRLAMRCVLTVPAAHIPWLPPKSAKAAFIPVGSNFPGKSRQAEDGEIRLNKHSTVVVFGVTEGAKATSESEDISYAMRRVISQIGSVQLMIIGRGSAEAQSILLKAMDGSGVDISVFGVLSPEQVSKKLTEADVLLCVRGHISSRRGSAIAGFACGLPIVGYRGEETAFPITEAGVLLVEGGDREGVADALCRVLSDQQLREELCQRSLVADLKYFSWDAIAAQYIKVLSDA